MKLLMRIASVILVAVAAFMLVVTQVFVTSPSGTSVISSGVLVDLVALALIGLAIWIWRRAAWQTA